VQTPRQPQRVLIDSRLDVPLTAKILEGEPPWIFCGAQADSAKADALRERGIEFTQIANEHGKVDLALMLATLADRGINELHVEAGHKLNGSLLREGCVDELLIYIAPSLLGNAPGMFDFAPPDSLEARTHLRFHRIDRIGDDLRILARFAVAKNNPASLT
jgi:diaminohydroxyphosphoribosylaminopyrimidine deaminase/5-amino-6-(5-phosphoribosylamino)uracil reductase